MGFKSLCLIALQPKLRFFSFSKSHPLKIFCVFIKYLLTLTKVHFLKMIYTKEKKLEVTRQTHSFPLIINYSHIPIQTFSRHNIYIFIVMIELL